MVRDADKFKAEDDAQRDRVSAKNGLESYAFNMKSTVEDEKLKDKISDDDKKTITEKCNEVIEWLDKNQVRSRRLLPSPGVRYFESCVVRKLYRDFVIADGRERRVRAPAEGTGEGVHANHHEAVPGCRRRSGWYARRDARRYARWHARCWRRRRWRRHWRLRTHDRGGRLNIPPQGAYRNEATVAAQKDPHVAPTLSTWVVLFLSEYACLFGPLCSSSGPKITLSSG